MPTSHPVYLDPRPCEWCRGQGIGAYLTDASGLDNHCPTCKGTGRRDPDAESIGEVFSITMSRDRPRFAYRTADGLFSEPDADYPTPEAAANALRAAVLGVTVFDDPETDGEYIAVEGRLPDLSDGWIVGAGSTPEAALADTIIAALEARRERGDET